LADLITAAADITAAEGIIMTTADTVAGKEVR
jgi:hypothetical protein